MNSKRQQQLLTVVDRLYASARDVDLWPDFLTEIADMFDTRGAQIGGFGLNNPSATSARVVGYQRSQSYFEDYVKFLRQDPRISTFLNEPFRPASCRDDVNDDKLHSSWIYKNVLRPAEVEYTLGASLGMKDGSLLFFSLNRDQTGLRFSESERELLGQLLPHLRRAVSLQEELANQKFESILEFETLESMGVGLMVVDKRATIHYANDTTLSVLREDDGITEIAGRAVSGNIGPGGFSAALNYIFESMSKGNIPKGRSAFVERPSGKKPLGMFLTPLKNNDGPAVFWKTPPSLVLVVIQSSLRRDCFRSDSLCDIYNLTASEARLAVMIANGLSLKNAAEQAGLTEASARQYLKSVFSKMDVSRQAEMVKSVMMLPPSPFQ